MKLLKNIAKSVVIAALAMTLSVPAMAQERSGDCVFEQRFRFKFASTDFDPSYQNNKTALEGLDKTLKDIDIDRIDRIDLIAVSSPDGVRSYNAYLSEQRCESAKAYFTSHYPELAERMNFSWKEEAWDELRTMVENDKALSVKSKQKVLGIIDDNECSIETKKSRLEQTSVYRYIRTQYFPELRSSLICLVRYRRDELEKHETLAPMDRQEAVALETDNPDMTSQMFADKDSGEGAGTGKTVAEKKKHECPPFAVKTNLLGDAAGAFNGELEVPIGPHWSVDAEWMAPWWLSKKNMWCYEMLSMNLEGRYWLGDRQKKDMLQGWFTSVYGNTGKYDFQNKQKGIQGVFWNVGVGGGYAWNVGKGWGMEAMLGVGYLHTRYEQYVPKEDYTILAYRQTLKTQWIGPTRLKVSIYYKFGQKWYNRKYRGINE